MNERDELADICYECRGYGDDYYMGERGELVCECDACWVTARLEANNYDP